MQDRPPAPGDAEVPDLDGTIHHALNLCPQYGAVKGPGDAVPPKDATGPDGAVAPAQAQTSG
ncbi:hypothetical protein GCM10023196_006110 [Actinoallomurus vinaceus]|uniref:Uncharacterized protein n=1 Tax=Actinoallomurus vinaceus TaxID=1080074 RepID=A0ABP8U479_9ACTN